MGKGNMDKNGPYNIKSFRNNRPVAPFFSGNSAIFMPTTTVSHSPILQAHHTTTQSNVTPFVEAIPPQAGLSPNIYKFTPHFQVVILAVLSIQPSTVSDGLEADKFEDDLVEIEGIWSHSASPMMKPLLNVHVLVTCCQKGLVRFSWKKLSIRLSSASLCLPLT